MPSLRASQNVNTDGLTRPTASVPRAVVQTALPAMGDGVSPIMRASLPVIASGKDLYIRQFYAADGRLPQRRFLPVGL